MLVLQRRVGECFILQDKTTGERFVVQQMKAGRPGIIASNNVRILREELKEIARKASGSTPQTGEAWYLALANHVTAGGVDGDTWP
jgi:sRNA-binding carbon storage regulator CsrA